jgi:hypothetical protein
LHRPLQLHLDVCLLFLSQEACHFLNLFLVHLRLKLVNPGADALESALQLLSVARRTKVPPDRRTPYGALGQERSQVQVLPQLLPWCFFLFFAVKTGPAQPPRWLGLKVSGERGELRLYGNNDCLFGNRTYLSGLQDKLAVIYRLVKKAGDWDTILRIVAVLKAAELLKAAEPVKAAVPEDADVVR